MYAPYASPTATVNCRTWPTRSASPACASLITSPGNRSICLIPAMCLTTTAAFFAPAAFASAPRSRALMCGMSSRVAFRRTCGPTWAGPGGEGQGGRRDGAIQQGHHRTRQAERSPGMRKLKLATVWLDGCSGCHMSLLDLDAGLIPVLRKVDIVYGPLVDAQEFPEEVDITLVEGAVSSQADADNIQKIRQRTKTLVSLGDCAVTGNVAAMRNTVPVSKLLQRIYVEGSDSNKRLPGDGLPQLLKLARPAQDYVKVDYSVPGCPPQSKVISALLSGLVEGRKTETASKIKFG